MKQMPVESFFFAFGSPISVAIAANLGLGQFADRETSSLAQLRLVQAVQEVALVLQRIHCLQELECAAAVAHPRA